MLRLARTLQLGLIAATLWAPLAPRSARGATSPAIDRGLAFLRTKAAGQSTGETAMIALALLKADQPAGDATVAACVDKLRSRISSGVYEPERHGGVDIYEAAVVALALANLDAATSQGDLAAVAQFLIGRQNANGSWDYTGRTQGDTSISQYAVLGLWEAENSGVTVPPGVWDRAAQFFLSVQSASGSWNYHRDEGTRYPETISMTAAGTGSLLICQRQLAKYRKGEGSTNALLTPLTPEKTGAEKYDVSVAASRVDAGAKRGMAWIGANFATGNAAIVGQTPFYALYGIERIGALADRETIGRAPWFDQGRSFIESKQRGDGAWDASHGAVPNTAWAILFLTRSTAKTLRKLEPRRLGAGTLLGGRGIPKDVSNLTVAGGRVVSRPMNGAIEGMLAVLEDPRATDASSALSGLLARYRAGGPGVLREHKDRFRKMLRDRDPDLRRVAAWALSRTGDLDAVPPLIAAVTDPEEPVVAAAREGLMLLSRKIDGLGPPSPSTPEQRQEAARAWQAWYDAVRPLELEGEGKPDAERAAATVRGASR